MLLAAALLAAAVGSGIASTPTNSKALFRSATKSGQVGGEVPHYRQGSWANTSLPAMPTARCGLAAAAINNTLYAVGGIYGNGNLTYVSTLEAFDPATRTWDSSLPDMPSKRAYVAAVAINNVLYVVGGQDANGNYLDTLEAFDPATRKWDRPPGGGWGRSKKRSYLAAVAISKVLDAVGGDNDDGFLGTLEAFDPATRQWDRSLPSMSTARTGLAAVAINNVLYAVGGYDRGSSGDGNSLDTLEAFDPATRKWDRSLPSTRKSTVAVDW